MPRSAELREWCVAEMDKTRPDIAAALHECFAGVDVVPMLAEIPSAGLAAQRRQKPDRLRTTKYPRANPAAWLARTVRGYGHGVNLLLPERCAPAALDFWREVEADGGS